MNRTLTESRHVIQLMDKMKGQFANQDRHKMSRVETEPNEGKPEGKLEVKETSKLTQRESGKGRRDGREGMLSL